MYYNSFRFFDWIFLIEFFWSVHLVQIPRPLGVAPARQMSKNPCKCHKNPSESLWSQIIQLNQPESRRIPHVPPCHVTSEGRGGMLAMSNRSKVIYVELSRCWFRSKFKFDQKWPFPVLKHLPTRRHRQINRRSIWHFIQKWKIGNNWKSHFNKLWYRVNIIFNLKVLRFNSIKVYEASKSAVLKANLKFRFRIKFVLEIQKKFVIELQNRTRAMSVVQQHIPLTFSDHFQWHCSSAPPPLTHSASGIRFPSE